MDIRGKGVNYNRVREIIETVSRDSYDGNLIVNSDAKPLGNHDYGFRGRVVSRASRVNGSRRSWSGRATRSACWHAYRDVIRAVLTEYPHAIVRTAQARYVGLEGFEDTYPDTAHINIGSMMRPAYMIKLCDGPCVGEDE